MRDRWFIRGDAKNIFIRQSLKDGVGRTVVGAKDGWRGGGRRKVEKGFLPKLG